MIFNIIERKLNSSLDESAFRLVDVTVFIGVLHVAVEALNAFSSKEPESSHNVIDLSSALLNHFGEFFDVNGVEHSHIVRVDFSLVEQSHSLVSVQSRVTVLIESTFGNSHEIHSQVHHTVVEGSVGQVGVWVV